MWVTKLLISPVKQKDFLPKNDQIWPKTGIFGQFGPGHAGLFLCPVGGSFGGCGARAVSRKTPIYFIVIYPNHTQQWLISIFYKLKEEFCAKKLMCFMETDIVNLTTSA